MRYTATQAQRLNRDLHAMRRDQRRTNIAFAFCLLCTLLCALLPAIVLAMR